MTKVTLHYDLTRALTDEDCEAIAALHATYGIARVQVAPPLDKITVDYDASRLMKKDVEAVRAPGWGAVPASAAGVGGPVARRQARATARLRAGHHPCPR